MKKTVTGQTGPKSDFCFFFCLFMVAPEAYGGSQARGPIEAVATGNSHSNTGSKPHL